MTEAVTEDVFILMTKHITPGGDTVNWEVFGHLESARERLRVLQKQTEQYRLVPMLVAPMLVQHLLFKAQRIVE